MDHEAAGLQADRYYQCDNACGGRIPCRPAVGHGQPYEIAQRIGIGDQRNRLGTVAAAHARRAKGATCQTRSAGGASPRSEELPLPSPCSATEGASADPRQDWAGGPIRSWTTAPAPASVRHRAAPHSARYGSPDRYRQRGREHRSNVCNRAQQPNASELGNGSGVRIRVCRAGPLCMPQ